MLATYLKIKDTVFTTKAFGFTVLAAVVYQIYFIFFGLDLQDSFFHATKMAFNDSYTLTFLSYKAGYLWCLIFGKHILGFRLLNVVLHMVMLLSPLCLIKNLQQKYLFCGLLFLVNIFFTLMNWNILGYDSFSFLSIIITTILSVKFIRKSNYKNLIFVGIAIAFSIACRFPNIVLVPVFVVVLVLQYIYYQTKFLKYLLILIASIILVYSLLIGLFFNSFSVFKQDFLVALSGTKAQHGLSKLINTYFTHFLEILKYSIVLIFFYRLCVYFMHKKVPNYLYVIPIVAGSFLYYNFIYGSGYNARASMFLGAIIFSAILLQVFHSYSKYKKLNSNTFLISLLMLFLFVPAMGSKSGLKYSGIFIVFLPFVYSYATFKLKPFFIILLFILIPFAVKERFGSKYMDSNHNKLTSYYNLQHVNGVFTTKKRVALADSIAQDYRAYKSHSNNIVFYGLNSYMYNYTLGTDNILFNTYRMDLDDEFETRKALSMISKDNSPVFFIISAQIKRDTLSLFESHIIAKSYCRALKKGYVILYPNTF